MPEPHHALGTRVVHQWVEDLDHGCSVGAAFPVRESRSQPALLGDFLSQPRDNGGQGLGSVVTSAIFLATILAVVVFLTRTKKHLGTTRTPAVG
jgi:uncharacterized membrane-anchored protein